MHIISHYFKLRKSGIPQGPLCILTNFAVKYLGKMTSKKLFVNRFFFYPQNKNSKRAKNGLIHKVIHIIHNYGCGQAGWSNLSSVNVRFVYLVYMEENRRNK